MQADKLRELPARWLERAVLLSGLAQPSIAELARAECYRSCAAQLESQLLAIAEGAEADRALLREAREVIADDAASMRECESVDGVVTDPAALPEIERLESIVRRIDAALAGAVTQGEGS